MYRRGETRSYYTPYRSRRSVDGPTTAGVPFAADVAHVRAALATPLAGQWCDAPWGGVGGGGHR